jgi:hypothetical protein
MENQIDDPLFKMIVLATIGCSILFITNQPTASIGKAAKHHRAQQSSVKANSQLAPVLKYQLKSNK